MGNEWKPQPSPPAKNHCQSDHAKAPPKVLNMADTCLLWHGNVFRKKSCVLT
jgi:hypothetical protein